MPLNRVWSFQGWRLGSWEGSSVNLQVWTYSLYILKPLLYNPVAGTGWLPFFLMASSFNYCSIAVNAEYAVADTVPSNEEIT